MTKKVLIATFSWSGQTQRVADQLAQLIEDADQYQIKVPADTYSQNMFETADIAKREVAANDFPSLVNPLPDFSQYDLILVGSPVWSGTPAAPVHTFLDQLADFNGKLASFYTDAGTPGNYEQVFKSWAGKHPVLPAHAGSAGLDQWVEKLLK